MSKSITIEVETVRVFGESRGFLIKTDHGDQVVVLAEHTVPDVIASLAGDFAKRAAKDEAGLGRALDAPPPGEGF